MNEHSLWTLIRFNELINAYKCSFYRLIKFFSIQGHNLMHKCFLSKLLLHSDLRHCVIFIQTINLRLAAPAVGLYSLNILYLDLLHQPKTNPCNPLEFNLPAENGAQTSRNGYSKATVNSCGSDISKKP